MMIDTSPTVPEDLKPKLKQQLKELILQDKALIKEQQSLPQDYNTQEEIKRLESRVKLWMLIAERNGFIDNH